MMKNYRAVVLVVVAFPFLLQLSTFFSKDGRFPNVFTSACVIAGYDSGECMVREDFKDMMPYCQSVLQYTACVPRYDESFANHTITRKDAWVKTTVEDVITTRVLLESDEELRASGVNEKGIDGEITIRFFENLDCQNAYKNYFCWINFPRCDDEDRSMIMCRSACENYMRACNFDTDIHRCGPEKWMNSIEGPETDELVDEQGYPLYLRDFFPGHPFRDNIIRETEADDIEIPVCTPAVKNGSASNLDRAGSFGVLAARLGVALLGAAYGLQHV